MLISLSASHKVEERNDQMEDRLDKNVWGRIEQGKEFIIFTLKTFRLKMGNCKKKSVYQ